MIYRKSFKANLLALIWMVAIFQCAFDKANLHWHQIDNNSTHHHHHDNSDISHEHDFNHQLPDHDSHDDDSHHGSSVDCCHIQGSLRGTSLQLDLENTFKIILVNVDYFRHKNFQDYKLVKSIKRTLDPPSHNNNSEMLVETLHSANPPPLSILI